MKDIVIEYKGKEFTLKSTSVFSLVESWEDNLDLTTYQLGQWTQDGTKVKPMKAARAFCLMLDSAGCKDYEFSEIVTAMHTAGNFQQSIWNALFSVLTAMVPPSDFIQDDSGDGKKKSVEA